MNIFKKEFSRLVELFEVRDSDSAFLTSYVYVIAAIFFRCNRARRIAKGPKVCLTLQKLLNITSARQLFFAILHRFFFIRIT